MLVDGWGARHYLTRSARARAARRRRAAPQVPAGSRAVAVPLAPAAPAASQALPRRRRGRVRRRHQHHRRHEHAAATSRRASTSRCASKARCSRRSCRRCSALWALVELVQFERSDVPLFPDAVAAPRAPAAQTAKFVIRDNLRHRRDIERAYLAAIRTAQARDPDRQLVLLSRRALPPRADRRGASAASRVTLLLQARVEYRAAALRVARAVRPAARRPASRSRSTTARSCTRRSP